MDERALLQRLVDIEDIKRLKARYFRSLDHKDWDEFAQVFARDAHLEVPEGGISEDGRDAVVRSVSTVLEGVTTVHHGHMPEIEITGDDTARGIWAMFDYVEFPVAEGGDRFGLKGYGHYAEDYVREDGEWRIGRLELSRLRVDPLGKDPLIAPRGVRLPARPPRRPAPGPDPVAEPQGARVWRSRRGEDQGRGPARSRPRRAYENGAPRGVHNGGATRRPPCRRGDLRRARPARVGAAQ